MNDEAPSFSSCSWYLFCLRLKHALSHGRSLKKNITMTAADLLKIQYQQNIVEISADACAL
jgi:hypothetical protein